MFNYKSSKDYHEHINNKYCKENNQSFELKIFVFFSIIIFIIIFLIIMIFFNKNDFNSNNNNNNNNNSNNNFNSNNNNSNNNYPHIFIPSHSGNSCYLQVVLQYLYYIYKTFNDKNKDINELLSNDGKIIFNNIKNIHQLVSSNNYNEVTKNKSNKLVKATNQKIKDILGLDSSQNDAIEVIQKLFDYEQNYILNKPFGNKYTINNKIQRFEIKKDIYTDSDHQNIINNYSKIINNYLKNISLISVYLKDINTNKLSIHQQVKLYNILINILNINNTININETLFDNVQDILNINNEISLINEINPQNFTINDNSKEENINDVTDYTKKINNNEFKEKLNHIKKDLIDNIKKYEIFFYIDKNKYENISIKSSIMDDSILNYISSNENILSVPNMMFFYTKIELNASNFPLIFNIIVNKKSYKYKLINAYVFDGNSTESKKLNENLNKLETNQLKICDQFSTEISSGHYYSIIPCYDKSNKLKSTYKISTNKWEEIQNNNEEGFIKCNGGQYILLDKID